MRRLYPDPGEESLDDVYADVAAPARPWLALGMVSSVDGAATIDGVSGQLGHEGDRAAFRGLRSACDVILVGAGTVRAEHYGPPRTQANEIDRRRARGQSDHPAIAVISASLDLTGAERLLTADRAWRPIVVTHRRADPARLAALQQDGVRIVTAGDERVDLGDAISALRDLGLNRILCEGGPHLNGQLLAAGLVDELFVTIAPTAVGGSAHRIVVGDAATPVPLELVGVRLHGGDLLLHYRVAR